MRHTLDAEQAAEATNAHYELPPVLFEAFLGRRMKYSCGLFTTDEDPLDEAQDASLRLIADRLGITGGERVLDIGCGWGSLTLFLAEELGCSVVAVTPSRAQARFVAERAEHAGVRGLVELAVGPFQSVNPPERSFDAVAMVEMVEHLPEQHQPLRKVRRLLRPGGRVFCSAFCYRNGAAKREYESRPASMHALRLYGFTAMEPVSELLAVFESAGLSTVSLIDTTAHYGPTMRLWARGIEHSRDRLEDIRPGFADNMCRYLEAADASWGFTAKHYSLTAVNSRWGTTEIP
jgi:cyclopropane-fatty-acyl-phospholipid synthase